MPANGAVVQPLGHRPGPVRPSAASSVSAAIDVVHVHEPNAPVVSWVATEWARSPLVGTFHAYSTRWFPNTLATLLGARRLYNKLHVRIAVSEAARWTARALLRRPLPDRAQRRGPRRGHHSPQARRDELRLLFLGPRRGAQGPARAAARLRGAARRGRPRAAHGRRRRPRGGRALPDGRGRHRDPRRGQRGGEVAPPARCRRALRTLARRRELRHGAHRGVRIGHAGRGVRHRGLPRRRPRRRRRRAGACRTAGRARRGPSLARLRSRAPPADVRRGPRARGALRLAATWPRRSSAPTRTRSRCGSPPPGRPAWRCAPGSGPPISSRAARPRRCGRSSPPRRVRAGAVPCATPAGPPPWRPPSRPPASAGWRSSGSGSTRSARR